MLKLMCAFLTISEIFLKTKSSTSTCLSIIQHYYLCELFSIKCLTSRNHKICPFGKLILQKQDNQSDILATIITLQNN